MDNRATINGPASVERNSARLTRLLLALKKPGLSDAKRKGLAEEVERIRTTLQAQARAITEALEQLDTDRQIDEINNARAVASQE